MDIRLIVEAPPECETTLADIVRCEDRDTLEPAMDLGLAIGQIITTFLITVMHLPEAPPVQVVLTPM
jgi:hypothetical protein